MSAGLSVEPMELMPALFRRELFLIDVRAPIEFQAGKIPHSVNLPILTNAERAQVGTCYKQQGPAAAIALGHQLVSGEIKEDRIKTWVEALELARMTNAKLAVSCFRGGLRSQLTQKWLLESGMDIPRVRGGYKAFRQVFRQLLVETMQARNLLVITGPTGAGKTKFLRNLKKLPILDLEKIAKHRGSAFGALPEPQPNQTNFENELGLQCFALLHLATKTQEPVLIEDESRRIGDLMQPDCLFEKLRASPVLYLDEPLSVRIQNTLEEYVQEPLRQTGNNLIFSGLIYAVERVSRKLGGSRAQEIIQNIQAAQKAWEQHQSLELNSVWIEKLLVWYYDPLYHNSFLKRKPLIIAQGTATQVQSFLQNRGA